MFSARRPSTSPRALSPPPLAGEVGPAKPGREGALGSLTYFSSSWIFSTSPSLPLPRKRRREKKSLRRAQLGLHLIEQLLDLAAFEPRDVVLILQQHAERVGHGRRIERHGVEFGQRCRPVERLGDAWRLEQILLAQRLHEADHLLGQLLADA